MRRVRQHDDAAVADFLARPAPPGEGGEEEDGEEDEPQPAPEVNFSPGHFDRKYRKPRQRCLPPLDDGGRRTRSRPPSQLVPKAGAARAGARAR